MSLSVCKMQLCNRVHMTEKPEQGFMQWHFYIFNNLNLNIIFGYSGITFWCILNETISVATRGMYNTNVECTVSVFTLAVSDSFRRGHVTANMTHWEYTLSRFDTLHYTRTVHFYTYTYIYNLFQISNWWGFNLFLDVKLIGKGMAYCGCSFHVPVAPYRVFAKFI